jgi:hypothetical protein
MPRKPFRNAFRAAVPAAVLALSAAPLPAQQPAAPPSADTSHATPRRGFVTLGSPAEEDMRVRQVLGREDTRGFLLRSPSTLSGEMRGGKPRVQLVEPRAMAALNSAIPYSRNDGSLWAGRGASVLVSAGVRGGAGPLAFVLAPEVSYAQNSDFDIVSPTGTNVSLFIPPWRVGRHSADLPLRFGDRSITRISPGQSSVSLTAGTMSFGAATENEWWGPGERNAIVMSDNASGIPRIFLRTARPLSGKPGELELELISGVLTESPYFSGEDHRRSLGGFAATFRPAAERNLTLGFAHTAVQRSDGFARHAFDALTQWTSPDSANPNHGAEQLVSLFGRWVFPADGFEVYAEWARHQVPSLHELLVTPNHTQGYTLGGGWTGAVGGGAHLRLRAEVTDLEQSATFATLPGASFYTSAAVPAGYTQRGESIGASIGPGASSQWLAADWLAAGGGLAGVFVERVRWDDDAFYTRPNSWQFGAHDVSVLAGGRARLRTRAGDLGLEAFRERRLNFLYQNPSTDFLAREAISKTNYSLRITVTPRP